MFILNQYIIQTLHRPAPQTSFRSRARSTLHWEKLLCIYLFCLAFSCSVSSSTSSCGFLCCVFNLENAPFLFTVITSKHLFGWSHPAVSDPSVVLTSANLPLLLLLLRHVTSTLELWNKRWDTGLFIPTDVGQWHHFCFLYMATVQFRWNINMWLKCKVSTFI